MHLPKPACLLYLLLSGLAVICNISLLHAQEIKIMLPIGHTGAINNVYFSPEGNRLLTGSSDWTARIWDIDKGIELAALQNNVEINKLQYSSDGTRIITSSRDHARIWDAKTGLVIHELGRYTKNVVTAKFSPDGNKVITCAGTDAEIWDAKTGALLITLKGHAGVLFDGEFSPDGNKVITCATDSTARIWDVQTGVVLFTLDGFKDWVDFAKFSPDGGKVFVASAGNTSKLWNATTGKLIANIYDGNPWVIDARFSPDGETLITVSRTVKFWNTADGKLIDEVADHGNWIYSINLSPDGKKFVTASKDATAKIWDLQHRKVLLTLAAGNSDVLDAKFSLDGNSIVTVTFDKKIKFWNALTGSFTKEIRSPGLPYLFADFIAPGIVGTLTDSLLKVWDITKGKPKFNLKNYDPKDNYIGNFEVQQNTIISSDSYVIHLWNAKNGSFNRTIKEERMHTFHFPSWGNYFAGVADTSSMYNRNSGKKIFTITGSFQGFSPDGKAYTTLNTKGALNILNAADGKNSYTLTDEKMPIDAAWYTKDGKWIFTLSRNEFIKIWNPATGTLVTSLPPLKNMYKSLFLSPDGSKIALINEGTRIVDGTNGTELTYIPYSDGHWSSFSPDSKYMLFNSFRNVHLRDAATGKIIATLAHQDYVLSAKFSSDGRYIVTAARDNTCKIWDAVTGAFLYTFFEINQNDYLIVDAYNHYDGTEAARKLIYFTHGTTVLGNDPQIDRLYVPQLAEKIMKGEVVDPLKFTELKNLPAKN